MTGVIQTAAGLVVPETALGSPTQGGVRGDTRVWHRAPEPAWVAALRAFSPPSAAHSWLHLAWEPGDPWEPVERWMLYQVIPEARVRPEVLAELRGPDPRSRGHYCGPTSLCGCPAHKRPDCWVGGLARLANRTEWRLYRETAALGFAGWARAFWVIQGAEGGHPRAYTETEAALAELADPPLPNEPPVPGELPYADPDERVWAAVRQYDRLARGARLLAQTADDLAAEDRAAAVAVRQGILAMLERTTRQALGEWGDRMRRELSDVRLGARAPERVDYDAEAEDFLADVD